MGTKLSIQIENSLPMGNKTLYGAGNAFSGGKEGAAMPTVVQSYVRHLDLKATPTKTLLRVLRNLTAWLTDAIEHDLEVDWPLDDMREILEELRSRMRRNEDR